MTYYRDSVDLSEIISKLTNSSVNSVFGNNNIATDYSYSSTFSSSIDEKPSVINYTYQGIDIQQYSIAPYTESNTNNFSASNLPSWCTKIRAVLIGGGGGGASAQVNTVQAPNYWAGNFTYHQNCNYYNKGQKSGNYRYQNNRYTFVTTNQAPNYYSGGQQLNAGGSGGGGGGFIYLPTIDITSSKNNNNVSITIGGGGSGGQGQGASGSAGGSTSYSDDQYNIVALGGGAATLLNGGNAGSTDLQTIEGGIGLVGGSGSQRQGTVAGAGGSVDITHIDSNTYRSYGAGGNGSSASHGSPAGGNNGANGFYRIYFLSS
jgi:hypothetical protein